MRRSAVVVVRNSQGGYLCGFKLKAQRWEFAGGKVENHESYRDAAIRELGEETGIVAGQITKLGRIRFDDWIIKVFTYATDDLPQRMEPDKHGEWRFFSSRPDKLTEAASAVWDKLLD